MKRIEDIRKNHTFKFLFPLMYDTDISDSMFLSDEFEGIYLGKDNMTNRILLIYKPTNTQSFSALDKKLITLNNFDTDLDLENGKICYAYKIPDKFLSDVEKFKEGKYSEFSKEYKDNILKFWGVTETDDPLYGILEKNDTAKENFNKFAKKYKELTAEGEYYPKPDMDQEYIKIPSA